MKRGLTTPENIELYPNKKLVTHVMPFDPIHDGLQFGTRDLRGSVEDEATSEPTPTWKCLGHRSDQMEQV